MMSEFSFYVAETYHTAFLSRLAASTYLKSDLLFIPWHSPSGLPTSSLFSNDAVWGTIPRFPRYSLSTHPLPIYKFNNHSLTCLFSHLQFSDHSLDTCVLTSLIINFQKFFHFNFMQSFCLVWYQIQYKKQMEQICIVIVLLIWYLLIRYDLDNCTSG